MSYYSSGNNYRKRGGRPASSGTAESSRYPSQGRYGNHPPSGNRYGGRSSSGVGKGGSYQGGQARRQYGGARGGQSSYMPRSNGFAPTNGGRPSDENQIWMGDLDPSWTEESITSIWTSFGEKPVGVKIMKDKAVPSKPTYCFVTFENPDIVARAMQKNGLAIPSSSRVLKLNFASAGGNSRFSGPSSGAGGFPKGDGGKNDNMVFVGDLAADVTETMLSSKFNEKYPSQIRHAKIMLDPATKVSKGYGFVRFYSSEAQKRALTEMNGVIIGSKPIRVGLAAGSAAQLPLGGAMTADIPDLSRIQIAQPQPSLTKFTDPHNTTLVIRGLSAKLTREELESHLLPFGDIIHLKLSKDLCTCHVKFHLRSAAENAILYLHGTIINECDIKITWGSEKQSTGHSKSYEKALETPILYGHLDVHNVSFETFPLNKDTAVTLESSERLPVSKVNELYLKAKQHRQSVLEHALY